MKTVTIIQPRMGSTRLPGKVLKDLNGATLLARVVRRVRRAKLVGEIVIATTVQPADDAIVEECNRLGVSVFRGQADDVLDRYYQAARAHSADTVIRITSDCPLIDPAVIDTVVTRFLQGDCDYASNTIRYTYPLGLDTEAFSFRALQQAWKEAEKPSEREHVTPYLRTGKFRSVNVERETPVPPGLYRWSVDHPVDLEYVRRIYSEFNGKEDFGCEQILRLLKEKPDLAAMQGIAITNEGYYRSLYQQAAGGAAPKRPIQQSQAWLARSRKVIPGCAQTFSKGYTQYVQGVAPVFLQRGKGCRVWDVDGNEYVDYVQGLLPNILGYAIDEVNEAVAAQLAQGHSFTLPHPVEVELAERLTRLIPCAEMVRFGKNGSDVTSAAVRVSRAFTGREHIACYGYHGWQDWCIGSTTRNVGVPGAVRTLTHPFRYNDLASLQAVLEEHSDQFAAVIMEPINFVEPAPGFLQGVKELAHKHGALLIFDEICSGFRFGLGGAQKLFGVVPDLATFGKAMANGFPISCVMGRADIMRMFEEVFFSLTFGGEAAAMAAAMKVLDILESTDALARMEAHGSTLKDGFNAMAHQAGLADRLKATGRAVWSLLKFLEPNGTDSMLLRSLFQQEALKRGVLLSATHNLCAAHGYIDIQYTLEAYASVFKTLAGWLQDKEASRFLEGSLIEPVFRVQ